MNRLQRGGGGKDREGRGKIEREGSVLGFPESSGWNVA